MAIKTKVDLSVPGYITVDPDTGHAVRYPTGSKLLANMVVALIRTLIEREVIDEDFADNCGMDITLDQMIAAIETVGGAYHDPDLTNVG